MSNAIYANTTAASLMTKLITSDKEGRLIDAKDGNSALKILDEYSFGEGVLVTSPFDFEKLCEQEEKNVYDFVVGMLEEDGLKNALLAKYHFHNLKCAVKAKYFSKVNFEEISYSFTSLLPSDVLKERIFADDYKELSPVMQKYALIFDEMKSMGTLTSQKIDAYCDVALFEEIFSNLKKSGEPLLKEYYSITADVKNISTAIRCKKYGVSQREAESFLICGGSIEKAVFTKFFEGKDDELSSRIASGELKNMAKLALESSGGVTDFELLADNTLLRLFKSKKFLPEVGYVPFLSYVLARENAIKNVRIIMVCLNNGVQKTEIKRRLREAFDGV